MKYVERRVATPLCAVSAESSLGSRTGTWRFSRPIFSDRVSPCSNQCPAGEDVAGVMYLAAQGRFADAWRLITGENPFPAVMGRVCYRTCERRCNRAEHDEAVSIRAVERFLGDYALDKGFVIESLAREDGGRAAVVGAGPAGLSAAYHLRLMGHKVRVFDRMDEPGGLMRYGIPDYRLPKNVLRAEISRMERLGIELEMNTRIGRDKSWTGLRADYDAVFLATGAHREKEFPLGGVPGRGLFRALAFLEQANRGVRPELGDKAAVVGGGNSAIDCARVCRRLGAEVEVIYRRSQAEMPAHPEEVLLAAEEGVNFRFLCSPKQVLGHDRVTGLRLSIMKLGAPDPSGRPQPEETGESVDLACESVVLAVGEDPDPADMPEEAAGEGGAVSVDEFGRTGLPDLFAGGDLASMERSVTHAVGFGKRAAGAMDARIRGRESPDAALFRWGEGGNIVMGPPGAPAALPRRSPSAGVAGYSDLNPFYFDFRPATRQTRLPPEDRAGSFSQEVLGIWEEEAVYEARRCFICGSCTECGNCYIFCPDFSIKPDPSGYGYTVDLDYCKGCGICVQECPRAAMSLLFEE